MAEGVSRPELGTGTQQLQCLSRGDTSIHRRRGASQGALGREGQLRNVHRASAKSPRLQRAERYALDPPFRHSKLRRGCECTLKRPPMCRPPLLPAPPGAPCTTTPGSATCNTAMHRSPCSSDNSATRFSPDESGSTSPIRSHQPRLRLIAMALGNCAALPVSVAQHSARFLRFSTAGVVARFVWSPSQAPAMPGAAAVYAQYAQADRSRCSIPSNDVRMRTTPRQSCFAN
jgi:hypothetical protein